MRYKIICQCTRCGHKWKRFTSNPDSPDPPCQNLACGEQGVPIGMDLTLNKAPGIVGGNIQVKAIDETAAIVMQDYGLTDLRDDVRPTETTTPKLPPKQQEMADNFFGGPGRRRMNGVNLGRHAAAAMTGALSDPVSTERSLVATHRQQLRAPTHILNRT